MKHKPIRWLKENGFLQLNVIPSYLAIAAGVFSLFSFEDVSRQLQGITIMLTFLVGSLLVQYIASINRIDNRTKNLSEKIGEADIFQYARSTNFWDYARDNGDKLFISGGSLYNVFADRSGYIDGILSKGKELYVVIMKPDSKAIELLYPKSRIISTQ